MDKKRDLTYPRMFLGMLKQKLDHLGSPPQSYSAKPTVSSSTSLWDQICVCWSTSRETWCQSHPASPLPLPLTPIGRMRGSEGRGRRGERGWDGDNPHNHICWGRCLFPLGTRCPKVLCYTTETVEGLEVKKCCEPGGVASSSDFIELTWFLSLHVSVQPFPW